MIGRTIFFNVHADSILKYKVRYKSKGDFHRRDAAYSLVDKKNKDRATPAVLHASSQRPCGEHPGSSPRDLPTLTATACRQSGGASCQVSAHRGVELSFNRLEAAEAATQRKKARLPRPAALPRNEKIKVETPRAVDLPESRKRCRRKRRGFLHCCCVLASETRLIQLVVVSRFNKIVVYNDESVVAIRSTSVGAAAPTRSTLVFYDSPPCHRDSMSTGRASGSPSPEVRERRRSFCSEIRRRRHAWKNGDPGMLSNCFPSRTEPNQRQRTI